MTYLWERPSWPAFNWTNSELLSALVAVRHKQGRLIALKQSFVHSYEFSDRTKDIFADLFVVGISRDRICGWQASLYPTGFAGIKRIVVGELRSKDFARSSLPYKNLSIELGRYLHWWTEPPVELDPFIRAALASFWFLCLSPFEEGNFTLACALAEKALSESEKLDFRAYDVSLQLEENKAETLDAFVRSASAGGDITDWILYFLRRAEEALDAALALAEHSSAAEAFWHRLSGFDLNQRQRKVLNVMFDERGNMTNRRYKEICKTSRESAKRDLARLVSLDILRAGSKKGRSVSYNLTLLPPI